MPTVPQTGDPDSEAAFKANLPGQQESSSSSGPVDLIGKHANRVGIDPSWLRKIMRVESNGDPNAKTGSYKGLFQLSNKEFARHGGTGNIYDPEQNTMAAANKISSEKIRFEQKYGRPATLKDIYMIHQQGEAGYGAHLSNPDQAAWKSVRPYYSSDEMAKKAIWGNMTSSMKAKYGTVDNVTSANFTADWGSKVGSEQAAPISTATARQKARHEGIPEDAGEPKPRREQEDLGPGFTPASVTHANVDAPDIRFGGPVTAPILSRAGRIPQ